jgi:UDP-3-O-[3-hydroxymyristoyl] glucosamine N-acyltransferase
VIGRDFKHGDAPSIGPLVTIGDRVTLGDRVVLHPGVFIGDDVVIGDDTWIYPNVTVLERCRLGRRVIVHSGTVIGSDGYGFAPEGDAYVKIPQLGIVQIDDDVEIGAGNTIDRGTFGRTWIGRGVKTDNLVHIAHNVTIGENTLLVAQVAIAGSVTVGKHVILAGQVGIAGHLTIGDNAIIGPQSGIAKSVGAGEILSGSPEMPHRQWLKMTRVLPELPDIKRKLQTMEKQLQQLVESKKEK